MPRGEQRQISGNFVRNSAAVIALTGVAALSAVASGRANAPTSHKADAVPIVGFDTDFLQSGVAGVSQSESDGIKQAQGNQGRIYVRYVPGSAEVKNMLTNICTASRTAYDNGQNIVYVMDGYFPPNPHSTDPKKEKYREGYIPDKPSQRNRFVSMVANLMWGVAGDKNPDGTGGCVPEQKNITISLIKEPNYSGNPNKAQNMRYAANLYTYSYPLLHKIAATAGLNVNLKIDGGELATSDSSNPDQSARDLKKAMGNKQGFDMFGVHAYANKRDVETQSAVGTVKKLDRIFKLIRSLWGDNMPIGITELGGNSATQPTEEKQYKVKLNPASYTFTGNGLANYYNEVVAWAACEGVTEIDYFHLRDDSQDANWRSGLQTPYGNWKQIAGSVNSNTYAARQGKINCPAH